MSGRSKPIQINQKFQREEDSDDDYGENQSDDFMTIGSLPGSRRSRRMMVSSGGNEMYGSLGARHSQYFRHHTRDGGDSGLTGADYMARSLPVPRAPNLHSRRDDEMDRRLSRIPDISLPGSVTEISESSSIPYGSLNESRLHFAISQPPAGIGLQDNSDVNNPPSRLHEHLKGNNSNRKMGSSVPAYIPNNAFGHASLSSNSKFGGIGSILSDENETLAPTSESILTTKNGGIDTSLSRHFEEKVLLGNEDGIGNSLGFSNKLAGITATALGASSQGAEPLSTSLTALSILENSKLPAGILSPTETDSIRAVARSLSDEGKDFGRTQVAHETQLTSNRNQVGGDSLSMGQDVSDTSPTNLKNNGQVVDLGQESDSDYYGEAFDMDMEDM